MFSFSGRGLHGAAGGGGLEEAGADPGGEACSQLHDGHTAYKAGKHLNKLAYAD